MTDREILMRKIAANDFALVDLHLFLDTHPNNKTIAKRIEQFRTKGNEMKKEFEERFGPLTPANENGNRWAWISNPWPWDNSIEEEC